MQRTTSMDHEYGPRVWTTSMDTMKNETLSISWATAQ